MFVVLARIWWSLNLMIFRVISHPQEDIVASLGPLLSSNAHIYFPNSTAFSNLTDTVNAKRPSFFAVVEVATAEDVEHTIQYSNAHGRPFLAVSGGHGETWTLGQVQNGIGISMRGMVFVNISKDGASATIGGGTESGEVITALWARGKQASTTSCDCAGIVAPILGGGHGWLQGRYGLLTDNIISAQLVLANGSSISVSETEHSDLFWALRGAGHNFGIVTSVEYRIYDVLPGEDQWAYEEYIFTQDKLEPLFEFGNSLLRSKDQTQPVELTHYGRFGFQEQTAVIYFWIIWQGTTVPHKYSDPVRALGPMSITTRVTNITGMNAVAGAAYNTPFCAKGLVSLLFGVSLAKWSIPGLRNAMDIFATLPPWLSNSVVLLEAYSTNKVSEIPEDSTAYPDRFNQILASPLLTYAPNASLDDVAAEYSAQIRSALVDASGQPFYTYVNYLHGDESLEAVYGYDSWRVPRLKKLKAEYDPLNRFQFYAPISPQSLVN